MRRPSLNHTFRLAWNASLCAFVPVPEHARAVGAGRLSAGVVGAVLSLSLATVAMASELPHGAEVVAGDMQMTQSATTLNIQQNSDKLITNWQQFNIGQGHTVNFQQPSASSVALNRVVGSDQSRIQGALNANGQVFLVNPNGVLFATGAQVNVGGIVATTHNISDKNFLEGRYQFSGQSTNAVVNQGNINSARSGYVSLVAARVVNEGTINTPEGKVLLGAGSDVLLDFGAAVKLLVKEGALNAMIESGGVIRAEGGLVYMSAKSAGDLASTVINHSGIIEAQTLATGKRGEVYLMGDLGRDAIHVNGRIDASAPHGGSGGFVETSAARVNFGEQVNINTSAVSGQTGTWLIDPTDFYISASGGDITGTMLSDMLTQTDVIIETATGPYVPITLSGNRPGNGDIFVNDHVSYAYHRLTLRAERDIHINAPVSLNLDSSNGYEIGLELIAGRDININASVDAYNYDAYSGPSLGSSVYLDAVRDININSWMILDNTSLYIQTVNGNLNMLMWDDKQGFQGRIDYANDYYGDLIINGLSYEVVNDFSQLYYASIYDPYFYSNLYAIGADLDASAYINAQLGSPYITFNGAIEGLGHSINNASISATDWYRVGLVPMNDGLIQNVMVQGTLDSLNIEECIACGNHYAGGLVGSNNGTIRNVISRFSSVDGYTNVGGVVGFNSGELINVSSFGSVSGYSNVGGLVGVSTGSIFAGYFSGQVYAESNLGGLVGANYGSISNGYAIGNVYGYFNSGGLVGFNNGPISSSSSAANVLSIGADSASNLGGLVGYNDTADIRDSSSTGCVGINTLDCYTGLGFMFSGSLNYSGVGGLVGFSNASNIVNSFSVSPVNIDAMTDSGSLDAFYVGGLVGFFATGFEQSIFNRIADSYSIGRVSIQISAYANDDAAQSRVQYVGGLVGFNDYNNVIVDSFSESSLSINNYISSSLNSLASQQSYVGSHYIGGLVGASSENTTIRNSYANGQIDIWTSAYNSYQDYFSQASMINTAYVGGLVGFMGPNSNIVGGVSQGQLSANSSSYQAPGSSSWNDTTNVYGVGGLVGFAQQGVEINNSTSRRSLFVRASSYIDGINSDGQTNVYGVGGIVGVALGSILVEQARAYGPIDIDSENLFTSTGIDDTRSIRFESDISSVGGLFGYLGRGSRLEDVSSSGSINIISNTRDYGEIFPGQFNFYFNSSIYEVGGLVGSNGLYLLQNFGDGQYHIPVNTTSSSLIKDAGSSSLISIRHYATGNLNVYSYTDSVGGLIGIHGSDSNILGSNIIEHAFATGQVEVLHSHEVPYGNQSASVLAVGGLVGASVIDASVGSKAIVKKSYADVEIDIELQGGVDGSTNIISMIGGLVGFNGGFGPSMGFSELQDTFACGSLYIRSDLNASHPGFERGLGGLVGFNSLYGRISNSYANGSISQVNVNEPVGGLVGRNAGAVNGSFWDIVRSGIRVSDGGLGLSSLEMRDQSIFTSAGWDFANIWRMVDGQSAPGLRFFNPEPPVFSRGNPFVINRHVFSQELVLNTVSAFVANLAGPSMMTTPHSSFSFAMNQTGGNTLAGGLINLSGGGMSYGGASSAQVGSNDED